MKSKLSIFDFAGGRRAFVLQLFLLFALGWGGSVLVHNAVVNLERQNIASGFAFLTRTAGFDISQTLIAYKNTDTYFRAFLVALLNTLLVAGISIVLASALGLALGIARLSRNWLVAKLALVYVEIVRNVPLLLWLLMMYFGVLLKLPPPEQSLTFGGAMLNRRGLYLPVLSDTSGSLLAGIGLLVIGGTLALTLRRAGKGRLGLADAGLLGLALVPAIAALQSAWPVMVDRPTMGRYNIDGGLPLLPELLALVIGLVTYTAAYIGEIVRGGIESVPRGQSQAGRALGLTEGQTLRLIVIPLALRAIIPPLTNQYVNLAKNSSLAVAIGYPDLVSVFAGTILNHTNQAVETIAITMAVYLTLSLVLSALMSVANARVTLKER